MKKLLLLVTLALVAFSLTSCRPSEKKRASYVKNHPEMNDSAKQAILDKNVVPGMTKKQVLASWGPPLQKHVWGRGTDSYREEYTYDHKMDFGERGQVTVVTLVNGKVTTVTQPGLDMYKDEE